MSITARDVMCEEVHVVGPGMSLPDLERTLFEKSVSGFPVVKDGRLIGMVSRSDVLRALCVEQSLAETVRYLSKLYTDEDGVATEDADAVAKRVAERVDHFKVEDFMTTKVISVSPDDSVVDVARVLIKHDIHRVPVTDQERLLGIVSTLDLTRLIAEGRTRIE